jgi:hypothetical protein
MTDTIKFNIDQESINLKIGLFDISKTSILYIIKINIDENFQYIKIGITENEPLDRIKSFFDNFIPMGEITILSLIVMNKPRIYESLFKKENSDNLNLINIIPNSDVHDKHQFESDHLVVKKAEIVKNAIFNLPEKYKRVMLMREIENRPYLEIAEMCSKEYPISMGGDKKEMPDPDEFLDIVLHNKGKDTCYVKYPIINYYDKLQQNNLFL